MFFRVVETSRVGGKTRITVETEDSGVALLLQFFETSSQFAHAFRYKADADLRCQDRAAERIAAEPARRAFGKEVLALYRSMKGVSQHKRYQRIRDGLNARGFEYTYSNVEGLVTRAIHDEQDERAAAAPVVPTGRDRAKRSSRAPAAILRRVAG